MRLSIITYMCLFSSSLFCHRTDILVSLPRHLSTAFLRMMYAREEYIILNEPFITAFAANSPKDKELTQSWWLPEAPTNYKDAESRVLSFMAQGPLFIKEIAFALQGYLQRPNPLIGNPEVQFIFLIRNPHHMLCSYYKGLGGMVDQFEDLATYEHIYELYNYVKAHHINHPLLICVEDFYNHTKQTVNEICNFLHIPFKEQMLEWESINNEFNITKDWHDLKLKGAITHWHSDALMSTSISKPRSYEVDEAGNPTFSEIADLADRARVKKIYEKNLVYYQLLLAELNA